MQGSKIFPRVTLQKSDSPHTAVLYNGSMLPGSVSTAVRCTMFLHAPLIANLKETKPGGVTEYRSAGINKSVGLHKNCLYMDYVHVSHMSEDFF